MTPGFGVQCYSFRDRPLEAAIQGIVEAGLSHCVLWQGHVEPRRVSRQELRQWRCSIPLSEFAEIRRKFQRAGIRIHAYYYSFRDDFSDEEIRRGFEMARALGVKTIEASANNTTAIRVDAFAARAGIVAAVHKRTCCFHRCCPSRRKVRCKLQAHRLAQTAIAGPVQLAPGLL